MRCGILAYIKNIYFLNIVLVYNDLKNQKTEENKKYVILKNKNMQTMGFTHTGP